MRPSWLGNRSSHSFLAPRDVTEALRFKVDENLPRDVFALLRSGGFDACHVLDQGMGGIDDGPLAMACVKERRAIVTLDLDFGDIRKYPPADHPGIVVLRLAHQDSIHVLEVFKHVLALLRERSVGGQLWIVDEQGVRVRAQTQ